MNKTSNEDIRYSITQTFSKWTAFSSTRSGCTLKSRSDIYPLLNKVDFNKVLLGKESISKQEFNSWHRKSAEQMNTAKPLLPIGWTTKLINVYLKTMVYVGLFGRPQLINHIHPPIDNGLWEGLKESWKNNTKVAEKIYSKRRIKDIQSYEDYQQIISGMEIIAQKENCLLIEVEQFWEATRIKAGKE